MHNTHRHVGPALFIQPYVEPYIFPWLDTRLLLYFSSNLQDHPGKLLYVALTNIMPNQLAICTHKGAHSLVHMCNMARDDNFNGRCLKNSSDHALKGWGNRMASPDVVFTAVSLGRRFIRIIRSVSGLVVPQTLFIRVSR